MNITKIKDLIRIRFLADLPISGGVGTSIGDAIVLNLYREREGLKLEHIVLNYTLRLQNLKAIKINKKLINENGSVFDMLEVVCSDGSHKRFFFDITKFHGKK